MGKSFSKLGWTVSIFFVALYLICLGWGLLFIKDPELMVLHAQLFALTFPGFTWISTGSFFLGLILSFIYGWLGVGLYKFICNTVCSKGGSGSCCN